MRGPGQTFSAIQGKVSLSHEQQVYLFLLLLDLFAGFINVFKQGGVGLDECDFAIWIRLLQFLCDRCSCGLVSSIGYVQPFTLYVSLGGV